MSARLDRWGLAAVAVIGIALFFGLPQVLELFTLLGAILYVSSAILAVSLGLVWGYGGILCFGQAAFFGLGAYAYAISVINLGDSTLPFLLSIALPAAVAAVLGYVMFYGRLSDVYVGVMTLVVTLILFRFLGHTAGAGYRVGDAPLGGFNGIPGVPTLNMPGDPGRLLGPEEVWYLSMAILLIVYFGLRWLLASHFGRVIVAIRENELRAELLGYDVRLYKLLVFALGAGIAGVSGCLFVNWNAFVDPNVFSLGKTAQILIWVLVGGIGTLIGPIIGAVGLEYLTALLGLQKAVDPNLVMGAILVVFVLFIPRGLAHALGAVLRWFWTSATAPRRQ